MDSAIKTMLAQRNSEMEKLERSEKCQLRMITSSKARIRLRYGKQESENTNNGETEARKIRMYETHNPGFCYLRNGEYRKKSNGNSTPAILDPIQCSKALKAILFTNDELDINKTMCLHLLGTHLQSKNHIQRKDGRLCSYVKAQSTSSTINTLKAVSQKVGTHVNNQPSQFDKMLPRYILDVTLLKRNISISSFRLSECDSGSDDESRKKRKHVVPVCINKEIRMIINSVLEALQAVGSSKLKALIDLASSPEELRNLLAREELQEYIIQLAGESLIMKPTAYDYVMSHIMFDKIPEEGTLETVAQVLEVYDYSDLKDSLTKIRRSLLHRHLALVNSNILPGKKTGGLDKMSGIESGKMFNAYLANPNSGMLKPSLESNITKSEKTTSIQKGNEGTTEKKWPDKKGKNVTVENESLAESEIVTEYEQGRLSTDTAKYDMRSISNSQRILVGLKVASLKSRPLNLHQFEGKKKVDLASIINPIVRPQETDVNEEQQSNDSLTRNFSLESGKRVRKSVSRISTIPMPDLENLNRALLANLRLEISESENKRRVNKFMDSIK